MLKPLSKATKQKRPQSHDGSTRFTEDNSTYPAGKCLPLHNLKFYVIPWLGGGEVEQFGPTFQAIPGESPNTILNNMCVVGSNGERTSYSMFYVARGVMERFSGGSLISISLPATDLECLMKNLIFNSLKFK